MFTIYRQVENSRLTLFTFIKKTLFYRVEQKSFRHMLKRMSAVVKIQNLMKNKRLVPENINAYIVPSGDAHQSEYIAPCDRRRQFVSNFTGSAGTVIVTENKSALWTDGRYYLQAEEQIGDDMILMKDGLPSTPSQADWLTKELPAGGRVGVDPYLMSMETWKPLSKTLKESGCCLVPVEKNLVDQTWEDRPAPPCSPLLILSLEYTGKSWQDKVEEVQKKMADKKCGALILTALDEIAYLFNLRGADIEYNPVFMSYAVVTENDVSLYIDDKKVTKDVEDHLNVGGTGMQVTIKDYSSIGSDVSALPDNVKGKIWISVKSSYALASSIPKERRFSEPSPIALMKAKKNEVEINGMKNAHIKDAVALCEFFNWVETEIGNGTITEISAADKQEEIKREQKDFVSLSFDTISSVGAHGAIIHYKPTPKTDKVLSKDQIYLNDSGTQYKDGTTDVTRTLHFGTPTDMEKECYTRVLKGYINLCTAVFPNGVKGHMLDTLARTALWDIGLDYLHGTGHGVGAFLNVHEGPCGISSRVTLTDVPLEEGMILSDEPGYYEDGKFGIRIENLVAVVKADTKFNFKNKGFLTFEPITLVPLQIKMISPSLLSQKEIDWINEYHTTIRDVVGPEMLKQGKKKAYDWMMKETQLIG